MSFTPRNIREISDDKQSKFANEIAKKISRFFTKDALDLLDDKEDIYTDGQDLDSVIRFHGGLISTKTFDYLTEYYPPQRAGRK